MKAHLIFKYKNYANLANSDVWGNNLKPDLLKIKNEYLLDDIDAKSDFDCVKRDIKRTTALTIINRIISLVEKADDKVSKDYAK